MLPRIAACLLLLLAGTALAAGGEGVPAGYQLAWSDEFDVDGHPNNQYWRFERGFQRNHELQWYQSENAYCRDGMLVIEARRQRVPNPWHKPQSRSWRRARSHAEYTSASLNTRDRFDWKYGLLEVRAKIDARPGLWPAIWTLGRGGRWPEKGEVDLMEYYDHSILANACWTREGSRSAEWDSSKRPLSKFGGHWADAFHVWRMWWDENEIRLLVDEQLLNAIDLRQVADEVGDQPHPFRQPHYLLLNLAVGGEHGGDPSGTPFPARYLIDYVRVYTPEGQAAAYSE